MRGGGQPCQSLALTLIILPLNGSSRGGHVGRASFRWNAIYMHVCVFACCGGSEGTVQVDCFLFLPGVVV